MTPPADAPTPDPRIEEVERLTGRKLADWQVPLLLTLLSLPDGPFMRPEWRRRRPDPVLTAALRLMDAMYPEDPP